MTDKELKRLSRTDLLEMMLALSKENEQLRKDVARLERQLKDRSITIAESGSLAEAVLRINGVAEATQAACEQYIENIRERSENQDRICQQMEQETRQRCDRLLAEAKRQAEEYLRQANREIEEKNSSYTWLSELMNEGVLQE